MKNEESISLYKGRGYEKAYYLGVTANDLLNGLSKSFEIAILTRKSNCSIFYNCHLVNDFRKF